MMSVLFDTCLSLVLGDLYGMAKDWVKNFFWGKKSIYEQLNDLKEMLKKARRLLNDAENRQLDEPNVKEWLDEIRDVIYRAQDLMEVIEDEARSKKERESETNPSFLMKMMSKVVRSISEVEKTVQDEIANILEELDRLLKNEVGCSLEDENSSENSTTSSGASSSRPLYPFLQRRDIHGRDDEIKKIRNLLLSNDAWGGKIGVLPIVGMGGLGKTTLAELIYEDRRWEEHDFELKAWVTVSADFDIKRIMKVILQKISPAPKEDSEEPTELPRLLKKALNGKKFLFVLDDAWGDNYDNWHVLKSIFGYGKPESRVIVTTRSEEVAINAKTGPIHHLQRVSDNHCWKIFVDHAFDGDSNVDQRLQNIGSAIVEKCGGLPLAVKSLGRLLRDVKDPKEWDSILNSHVWERCKKIILPSLWLSYRYLPNCLKQCFVYCSVFPKNYIFQKHEIILLWMAQGFLDSDKEGKSMEEVGEGYFNDLITRSFFQRSSTQDELNFVMHDLVHDLAMFVSREFCFTLDNNNNDAQPLLTSTTRHFYFDGFKGSEDEDFSKALSEVKHLRTFIGTATRSSTTLFQTLIAEGQCLRVFSLSQCYSSSIYRLPDSFSNLKHLRYLNLCGSKIEEIPSSICTMYKLQTLLLSSCEKLTRLPNDLGRLISLRHLDTTESPLIEMPPQMANLKVLRTLTDFVLGESKGCSIKELRELQHLCGKLRISGLQNVNSVKDVQEANLRKKRNLCELALEWEDVSTDATRGSEVLNALEPHIALEKLTIRLYPGSNFPEWVGRSSFSYIVSVHLSTNQKFCSSLPPLGQLPKLRELVIEGFDGVETIGAEFYGNNSSISPFQSLETLSFCKMQKWKQWSLIGEEKKGVCFPHLKQLHLKDCPNLKSLPHSDTIEILRIMKGCKELEFPGSHQYVSVTELHIIYCDSLKSLPLDYFPSLRKLSLSYCENLTSLTFPDQESGTSVVLQSLDYLELVSCKNLRSLPQHMHKLAPSLARMVLSSCEEIESFPEGGLPSKLKHLTISNCYKLVERHGQWDLQGLTSLKSLWIFHNSKRSLDSFPEGLLPVSLTNLYISSISLRSLNGSAFEHTTSLEVLSLTNCKLQILPEQVLRRHPTSLRRLYLSRCPNLRVRYKEGKGRAEISHIPEIIID